MDSKFVRVKVKPGIIPSSDPLLIVMNLTKKKPLKVKMGLDKLIALGAALAILAAPTGQLPNAIRAVHIAQLKIIKQSQASKWPKAYLLPNNPRRLP